MKTKLEVENPKDIEFTLTMTMKLKDWEELRDSLAQQWPASDLSRAITDMTYAAGKNFYPESE